MLNSKTLFTLQTDMEGLLEFTVQDHHKRGMEENQDPEHCTEYTVKKEESDPVAVTTIKQVSVHDFMIKPAS